ncbi:hypothetical protein SLE2022_345250 [Rubroshorea leprosula]
MSSLPDSIKFGALKKLWLFFHSQFIAFSLCYTLCTQSQFLQQPNKPDFFSPSKKLKSNGICIGGSSSVIG